MKSNGICWFGETSTNPHKERRDFSLCNSFRIGRKREEAGTSSLFYIEKILFRSKKYLAKFNDILFTKGLVFCDRSGMMN